MATRGLQEQAHAFDERGMDRAVAAIKRVEAMGNSGSTQRRRWPQGDEGSPPTIVRRGRLQTEIDASQLAPAVLVQGIVEDVIDENDLSKGGTATSGNDFYAVNPHDTHLDAGVYVTCLPWKGDLWAIVQADCHPLPGTQPPPPPPCDPAQEPTNCPPNTEPCCVNGAWTCCDIPPPPPDGDCGPMPDGCFFGLELCCVDGLWQCLAPGCVAEIPPAPP